MSSFKDDLQKYLAEGRDKMRDGHNRVLPVGELMFNRFDKAEYLGMGKGSSAYDSSVIMGDVEVGENVWIGPNTVIEGIHGKIKIKDGAVIATGSVLVSHDSSWQRVSGGVNPLETGDITIGINTSIASNCTISCGVTVGSYCIVGANSFVNKDIPDYSVAVGSPAKVIGKIVFDEDGKASMEKL